MIMETTPPRAKPVPKQKKPGVAFANTELLRFFIPPFSPIRRLKTFEEELHGRGNDNGNIVFIASALYRSENSCQEFFLAFCAFQCTQILGQDCAGQERGIRSGDIGCFSAPTLKQKISRKNYFEEKGCRMRRGEGEEGRNTEPGAKNVLNSGRS